MVDEPTRAAVSMWGRNGGGPVPTNPTLLVPIRYPLTAQSIHTLERAGQLADECDAKEVVVLHVDLFHHARSVTSQEIDTAIAPIISDQPVSVSVRRSFFIEEAILEEATSVQADIIVLEAKQTAAWRRVLTRIVGNRILTRIVGNRILTRIVGNRLDVVSFLRDRTDAEIIVVE